MNKIIELVIICLVMMMVVGALTPADVVRKAVESEKPVVNTHGVNASVFKTDAFANQNILKGKHFLESPVDDDILSKNATQNFIDSVPELFSNKNESFHSDAKSQIFNISAGSSIDAFLNSEDVATEPGQTIEDFLNAVNETAVNETSVNATRINVTNVNATNVNGTNINVT
jgi:hypothetical protein